MDNVLTTELNEVNSWIILFLLTSELSLDEFQVMDRGKLQISEQIEWLED